MAILLSLSSNATPMSNDQGVRLDRWLFAARFFKTRHLASEAAHRNHVVVNQQRAKPGKRVFTGDRVSLRKGPFTYDIEIIDLAEKRLAPARAAALYQEDDDQSTSAARFAGRVQPKSPSSPSRTPTTAQCGRRAWPA